MLPGSPSRGTVTIPHQLRRTSIRQLVRRPGAVCQASAGHRAIGGWGTAVGIVPDPGTSIAQMIQSGMGWRQRLAGISTPGSSFFERTPLRGGTIDGPGCTICYQIGLAFTGFSFHF